MLKFGNKEFRNLQEQVEANKLNIQNLREAKVVLEEFGIKIVGEVATTADVPSVADYKAAHEDWEYGDAYAIGSVPPHIIYILTKANDNHLVDYWFNLGEFPARGPQGPTGLQGPIGAQGPQGNKGDQGIQGPTGAIGPTGVGISSVTIDEDNVIHVTLSNEQTQDLPLTGAPLYYHHIIVTTENYGEYKICCTDYISTDSVTFTINNFDPYLAGRFLQ